MSCGEALYYPYIEISNPAWLKNAALFWKRIHTIVPSGVEPYRESTAREFFKTDVLRPLYVEPNMGEIEELGEEVLDYVRSAEGARILLSKGKSKLHLNKFSEELRNQLIHRAKLPDQLRKYFKREVRVQEVGDWLFLPSSFVYFYMSLLTSNLSYSKGLCPVTDKKMFDDFSILCKRGNTYPGRVPSTQIKQGTLFTAIQQTVKISAATPVEKIIEFRDRHMNELIRFRERVRELAEQLDFTSQDVDGQLSEKNEIIQEEIKNLEESLEDMKIKHAAGGLISTAVILAAPVGVFTLPLAGLTVGYSIVTYRMEKRDKLRENPCTYIFSLRKTFG